MITPLTKQVGALDYKYIASKHFYLSQAGFTLLETHHLRLSISSNQTNTFKNARFTQLMRLIS